MDFRPASHPAIVHRYTRKLIALELASSSTPTPSASTNTILWIGGLSDGLCTVTYSTTLSGVLPPNWTLVNVLLTSSYSGWGTSSLARDATELSKCVSYFRNIRPSGKIVLMGHSTGCQDIVTYVTGVDKESRPKVDGAILQAPASDRYATEMVLEKDVLDNSVKLAQSYVREGRGQDVLPAGATNDIMRAPVSAERWLSLVSPDKKGADDLFSEDLEDGQLEKSFGRFPKETPLCVLYSGEDEFVPETVDKEALLKRWKKFVDGGGGIWDGVNSGVVPGVHHNCDADGEEEVGRLLTRVKGFIRRVEAKDWDAAGHGSHL